MATADKVMLPDGSEQNASDLMCEGCEKPISQHSCGTGSVTTSTTLGGGSSFRTAGRRKDPTEGPLCPHCNGRLHTNMPGYLQNLECAARQYGVDTTLMSDPFQRVPLNSLEDIAAIFTWKDTLKEPLTYGKMESATGAAGTYASLRPKADPTEKKPKRAKKQKPAASGEKIEDIAAAVTTPTVEASAVEVKAEKPAALTTEERAARRQQLREQRRNGNPVQVMEPIAPADSKPAAVAVAEPDPEPAMSIEELKAARRAALLGRR